MDLDLSVLTFLFPSFSLTLTRNPTCKLYKYYKWNQIRITKQCKNISMSS